MSPPIATLAKTQARFPRVSGDEPVTANMLHPSIEFSPRERG